MVTYRVSLDIERGTPLAERAVDVGVGVEGKQVERDERSRCLLGEPLHPRGGGVDALEQRLEVQPRAARDDDFAVDHAAGGQVRLGRCHDLGEVAGERPLAAAESSTSSPSRNTMQRKPSHFGS